MSHQYPSYGTNTHPSSYQFAIMWRNNSTYSRPMSSYTVTLRDGGGTNNLAGITAKSLHLDQVHIIFRPTSDMTTFEIGDDINSNWRMETTQLMVRTNPGNQHILYATNSDQPESMSVVREPMRSVIYSAALMVTPDIDGVEDYWCRTYRTTRDLPVAENLINVSELNIELIFPLLFADNLRSTHVPNNRIIKVLCEFSVNQ